MINFTFSSVLTAILCCNILITFLTLIFMNDGILLKTGFRTLDLALLSILLRLLFPFELPITANIYFPYHFSGFISIILRDSFGWGKFSFSIWDLMVIIWGIGCLFILCRYIYANLHFFRMMHLRSLDITDHEPYASLLRQICSENSCKKEIRVMKSTFVKEPFVCRHRIYYILLPDILQLDSHELTSILSHEIFHIMHHDLMIKELVHTVSILYWWNPFCALFQKQVDLLLELQADQKTGGKTDAEKIGYLSCLIQVAGRLNQHPPKKSSGLAFTTESGILLKKRLTMLMENKSEDSGIRSRLILLPVCVLLLCSFLFILEPYGISPEDAEGTFELTPENSYIIQLDDGTYDIYYNDNYLENTDSLEYYPNTLKIYTNQKCLTR